MKKAFASALLRGAKKGANSLSKKAKKAHLGKKIGSVAKTAAIDALKMGMAVGMGAYRRSRPQRNRSVGRQRVRGSGAYSVPGTNSLFTNSTAMRSSQKEMGDETERIVVSRREYVQRVLAPAANVSFAINRYQVNPGLASLFAWLSQVAVNYDEYSLKSLVFHYKPVISQASLSGAMGSVLMAANYNPGAASFASFREMAEYAGSMETRVCDEALFGVECDVNKNTSASGTEYVRAGQVPAGQDIKTYDLASFQIATSDVQSYAEGTLLGHLYVEYTVVLGKPKLYAALGRTILTDLWKNGYGVSVASPFGTAVAPVPNPNNNLGVGLIGTTIIIPQNFYGRLEVTYCVQCTTAPTMSFVPAVGSGVAFSNIMGPTGTSSNIHSGTAASGFSIISAIFDVAPSGIANTINLTLTGLTGGASMSLYVAQANPALLAY